MDIFWKKFRSFFHRAFIMSKNFGGKLNPSEDEMFARSDDRMEDLRYSRSCSVADYSDSTRSPVPSKDLKRRASRDGFSDVFSSPVSGRRARSRR